MFRPLLAAAFVIAFGSTAAAATYDIESDFSEAVNPSGPWSFGFYATFNDPASLTLLPGASDLFSTPGLDGYATPSTILIMQNTNATDIVPFTGVYPAGAVIMHPSFSNQQAVIRFTAQTSGQHAFDVLWSAADLAGSTTTTDTQVIWNGAVQSVGAVNGASGLTSGFNSSLSLTSGDFVDFVVGYGSDGSHLYDSTRFEAVITTAPVPLPAGLGFLILALTALGFAGRQRSSD